jgi:uncharacterized protein YifE (UPF0438 family)
LISIYKNFMGMESWPTSESLLVENEKGMPSEEEVIRNIEKGVLNELSAVYREDGNYTEEERDKLAEIGRRLNALESESVEINEMEMDWAKIRIVYEDHHREHHPRVVQGLNAYLFEGVGAWAPGMDFDKVNMSANILPNQKNVIDFIARESDRDVDKRILAKDLVDKLSKVPAIYYSIKFMNNIGLESKITRRNFLKLVGAAGVADVAERVLKEKDVPKGHKQLSDFEKIEQKIIEKFGLSDVLVTLRNALWAQKMYTISKRDKWEKDEKKPYFGIQVGAKHSGLEDFLRLDEKTRLEIIGEIMSRYKIPDPEKQIAMILESERYDEEDDSFECKFTVDESIVNAVRDAG